MVESAIVLAIVAAFYAWRSARRVEQLSQRVSELEDRLGAGGTAAVQPTQATADPSRPATPMPAPSAAPWGKGGARKKASALAGLGSWIKTNWIYPVAGAALIMAAVYLVQYSIERGLLSPQTRIALALLLGAGLITLGDVIRRRWGDEGSSARLLPSTFSGAGVVALLAAILAAHHLYNMLSPTVTLLCLAAIAALAMALGWLHGPLLAAIGVLAGAAAPFLIVSVRAPQDLLYAYFALIALLGLGIDGLRRWGWISGLAVIVPLAAGVLIYEAGAGALGQAMLALLIALLAMALPAGGIVPLNDGTRISQWRRARPTSATVVSALGLALSCGTLLIIRDASVALLGLGILALIIPLWTRSAPALADQILMPVVAGLAAIGIIGITDRSQVLNVLLYQPWLPFVIITLLALSTLAMIARSRQETGGLRDFWAMTGIGVTGATVIAFELFWSLSAHSNASTWSLIVMALAAGYVAVALWAAKHDQGQGLLLGASAAAAFAMIGFGLMLTLSLAALTMALAILMVVAAAMDRRFNIPMLGWFLALGSMALGWRIVVNPGLSWMLGYEGTGGATTFEVVISLAAALGGPLSAIALTSGLARNKLRDWASTIVETGLAGLFPVALSVLIARFLVESVSLHAHLGLQACVFIALAWLQLLRAEQLQDSRALSRVRRGLSFLFAVGAGVFIVAVVFVFSPLANSGFRADPVVGSILLNDLLLAYAMPGAVLVWTQRNRFSRGAGAMRAVGYLLLTLWLGCVIRHLWHGGSGMGLAEGFKQGELYAYTVALLVAGAIALALALRSGRSSFRLAGLALIAIAAAKAFLIDASGLTGLMRVGAFLGLGGALAGLAWLNAWVSARVDPQQD